MHLNLNGLKTHTANGKRLTSNCSLRFAVNVDLKVSNVFLWTTDNWQVGNMKSSLLAWIDCNPLRATLYLVDIWHLHSLSILILNVYLIMYIWHSTLLLIYLYLVTYFSLNIIIDLKSNLNCSPCQIYRPIRDGFFCSINTTNTTNTLVCDQLNKTYLYNYFL